MVVSENELTDALMGGAAVLGLSLSHARADMLLTYLKLLRKWQSAINLIATDDAIELIQAHVLDSLAARMHIRAESGRLLDVGSGAGFPAVPLAITCKDWQVTALEPARKKHAFLATVRRELSLSNFSPLAERLEQHAESEQFEAYDTAISRATFPLLKWLNRARQVVKPGGLIIGMEGAKQAELPDGAKRHPYELPGRKRQRSIITFISP